MPTFATHIVLAEQLIRSKKLPSTPAVFVGTSFPDIRYYANIDRTVTHNNEITFTEVLNEKDDFFFGFKLHSLVDQIEYQYAVNHDIYKKLPKTQYISHALKFAEDAIMYHEISDWNKYIDYLDVAYEQEKVFGIDDQLIKNWHEMIKDYLRQPTNEESIAKFIRFLGSSEEVVEDILKNKKMIESLPELPVFVEGLYRETVQIAEQLR